MVCLCVCWVSALLSFHSLSWFFPSRGCFARPRAASGLVCAARALPLTFSCFCSSVVLGCFCFDSPQKKPSATCTSSLATLRRFASSRQLSLGAFAFLRHKKNAISNRSVKDPYIHGSSPPAGWLAALRRADRNPVLNLDPPSRRPSSSTGSFRSLFRSRVWSPPRRRRPLRGANRGC